MPCACDDAAASSFTNKPVRLVLTKDVPKANTRSRREQMPQFALYAEFDLACTEITLSAPTEFQLSTTQLKLFEQSTAIISQEATTHTFVATSEADCSVWVEKLRGEESNE